MQDCLASTGTSLWLVLALAGLVIIAGVAVFVFKPLRKHLGLFVAALAFAGTLGSAVPSYAADCVATANPDTSTGAQGQAQTFNVLTNDSPSPNATFVLSSLRLALVDNPVPGSTLSDDQKTVTVPSEGTYVANNDGTITFTPVPSFVGMARGVKYAIRDTAAATITGTYTPKVIASSTTPPTTPTAKPVAKDDVVGSLGPYKRYAYSVDCGWRETGYILRYAGAGLDDQPSSDFEDRTFITANDSATAPATLDRTTVDLNPDAAGIQQTTTVMFGSIPIQVSYSPATDALSIPYTDITAIFGTPYVSQCPFYVNSDGSSSDDSMLPVFTLTYTVADSAGATSAPATVRLRGGSSHDIAP